MDVVEAGDIHSRANTDLMATPLPDSAPRSPATKKGKTEPSLSELQDNMVRFVAEKNERKYSLATLIKKNADTTEALKDSSEFIFGEIPKYEERHHDDRKELQPWKTRQLRWSLRLPGLPEREGEEVTQHVMDTFRAVIPCAEEDLRF